MAKAYRCDGCRLYIDDEPFLQIEHDCRFSTLSHPPSWDLCSWACLEYLAREQQS